MIMKKLTLLKTLATLGVCSLVGVCAAETVLLFNNKSDNKSENTTNPISLSQYNN
jgi:hypothetical protein